MQRSFHIFWVFLIGCCIISCSKQIYTADIDTSYYRINSREKSDKDLDKLIDPYKEQLDSKMNVVIAFNEKEMTKGQPNSTLGNWFADVLLEAAEFVYKRKIDIAVQNSGGIRVPFLKQGDITIGNIYELMPFDNKLVLLTMDGMLLQQLLDKIAERGGWPVNKSLQFTIEDGKAVGVFINGEPLDLSKKYTVALADYIANGGDDCFFLDQAEREDNDVMIRDLIIDYLKRKPENDKNLAWDDSQRILKSNSN